MTDYPDNIMKAGRRALADLYIENGFSPTCGRVAGILSGQRDKGEAIQAAASAIMAERQRCVSAAISIAKDSTNERFARVGAEIVADLIRSGDHV
jgi:hypothetical protein